MGTKGATLEPEQYIRKTWGDRVAKLSNDEIRVEAATMVLLRKACSQMAFEDLSMYTSTMASILNVKRNILGCDSPVLDRKDWVQSLLDDSSSLQIQKWLFAWMYVRSNYKKMIAHLKHPDERFEQRFMEKHGLRYDEECLKQLKKMQKLVFVYYTTYV